MLRRNETIATHIDRCAASRAPSVEADLQRTWAGALFEAAGAQFRQGRRALADALLEAAAELSFAARR